MLKNLVQSFLARCDALVARVPSPVRTFVSPFVAPFFAAGRTFLLTVTGNVQAILDEPLVTGAAIIAAVNAVAAGSSIKVYISAGVMALLRAVVHTGVGPNAASSSGARAGGDQV